MKVFKLQLHSVIDVITNSSTEIFSFAHSSGIDNIKQLFENMIVALDSSVTYGDIVKCIYIAPEDDDKELAIFAKYLKQNLDRESKALDIDESTYEFLTELDDSMDLSEIEDSVYDFNSVNCKSFKKLYFENIDMGDFLATRQDYADFLSSEISAYNDENYDYQMSSSYVIIANDEKYSKLVDSITKIMESSYTQEAQYC